MNELRTEKGGKRERHASVGWTTAAPTATEDPWPKRLFCRPSPAVAAGRAAALQGRGRRGAGGQVAGGRAGAEAAGAGGGAGWGRAALVAAVCRPRGRHRRVGDTGHRRAPTPHHNRGGGGTSVRKLSQDGGDRIVGQMGTEAGIRTRHDTRGARWTWGIGGWHVPGPGRFGDSGSFPGWGR